MKCESQEGLLPRAPWLLIAQKNRKAPVDAL